MEAVKEPAPMTKPGAEKKNETKPDVKPEAKPEVQPAPSDWRIVIRNTPCGAHARFVRTQNARTADEAWEKFKVAVLASMRKVQTKSGAATVKAWEAWLTETGGKLPKINGHVIPESEAKAILNGCLAVAPPENVRS